VIPNVDLDTPALKPCATVDDPFTSDLTWLLHRAERALARDFDEACRSVGLKDMRDTLVLAVAGDGEPRTQIEIAHTLGLDKTTLGAIIDRLEKQGYLLRAADAANRRVRIPTTTPTGQDVLNRALQARDKAVKATMAGFTDTDTDALRTLLWRIATTP
jgi:DNA-binding MarR family transcriptional regulator